MKWVLVILMAAAVGAVGQYVYFYSSEVDSQNSQRVVETLIEYSQQEIS